MTLYRKSVILRDWDIQKKVEGFKPKTGINVAWQQVEGNNNECYATLIGSNSKYQALSQRITKEDIHNQLAEMPVMSDRVRTLNSLPKGHTLGTVKERIV
jgi:hypothetical protein